MSSAGLSIREAARLFAVSRPTLAKWISTGKISAAKSDSGEWLINPSEMIRLGIAGRPVANHQADNLPRPKAAKLSTVAGQEADKLSTVAGQIAANSGQEIEALKAKLAEAERRAAVAEAVVEQQAGRIDDLRRMLPLTDQRANSDATQEPASGRSWWRRLIGRG